VHQSSELCWTHRYSKELQLVRSLKRDLGGMCCTGVNALRVMTAYRSSVLGTHIALVNHSHKI